MIPDIDSILASMGPEARDWYDGESDSIDIVTQRSFVEKDRTLSAEAIGEAHLALTKFMLVRMLRRWNDTGEPPTVVKLSASLDIG